LFIPCLENHPTFKSGDLEQNFKKIFIIFYLFSDLRPKNEKNYFFLYLFLFRPPLHHLHCKYGAPKQAKHEQINVLRPVSEQNFIPE
jgi:hypothetical protein